MPNLFSKPVEIEIGKSHISFQSLKDFEFAMEARTGLCYERVANLHKLSVEQLKEHGKKLAAIEKTILAAALRFDQPLVNDKNNDFEIELQFFSREHNWRDIIKSLREGGEELNPYRRAALSKYVEYLSAWQGMIRQVCKQKGVNRDAGDVMDNYSQKAAAGTGLNVASTHPLRRLHKGELYHFPLTTNSPIELFLPTYKCIVLGGESVRFIEEETRNEYILNLGNNTVGRSKNNKVVLSRKVKEVSRLHLLISLDSSQQQVGITDISTYGTYINR